MEVLFLSIDDFERKFFEVQRFKIHLPIDIRKRKDLIVIVKDPSILNKPLSNDLTVAKAKKKINQSIMIKTRKVNHK